MHRSGAVAIRIFYYKYPVRLRREHHVLYFRLNLSGIKYRVFGFGAGKRYCRVFIFRASIRALSAIVLFGSSSTTL
jgi:hypothetical protein